MKIFITILTFLSIIELKAQGLKTSFYPFEGSIVMGYVDKGAYLNFVGPSLGFSTDFSKISIGMLPSIRIKKDISIPKNSLIFPSLGIGITYSYKYLVFQLPLYYNFKTATTNGNWQPGFGIGYRFIKKRIPIEKLKNGR